MNLAEFLVIVLATFALSVIVVLLFRFMAPPRVVVIASEDVPARWWPWSATPYNHWSYWMGGASSGGASSGITSDRSHRRPHPHHEGGDHARPWGGAQRGANGGAGHHVTAPSAPSAPSK